MSNTAVTTPDHAAQGHPHDDTASKIGMWLFLFTELLLFGGLFLLFASYLHRYPAEFHLGGQNLSRVLGTTNTVVLITSSFLVAMAVGALQRGKVEFSRHCLLGTVLLAMTFLVIKSFEWGIKFGHGLYPGGDTYMTLPLGEKTFFNMYYMMTGLHAIHVIIGSLLILWVWQRMRTEPVKGVWYYVIGAVFATVFGFVVSTALVHHGSIPLDLMQQNASLVLRNAAITIVAAVILLNLLSRMGVAKVTPQRYIAVENIGLYWHLVDLIWIYLFPLFYLAV